MPDATTPGAVSGPGPFSVTDVDGVPVVHRSDERLCAQLVDAAASLAAAAPDGQATVLVAAVPTDDELDVFTRRLAPVMDELRTKGVPLLRLVMSQGAVDRAAAPSPARRLCEDWALEIVAASGPALVVPGGTLFSPDGRASAGGWWHFVPGSVPRRLGARFPVPDWEGHLTRVDPEVAEGHLLQAVPAGLLVQPAGMPLGAPDGIGYAVPVDPDRPQLLVGVPGAPPVGADALASVLAALPGRARNVLRLLPADGRDLLTIGQETANALGLEVEVASGLSVLLEDDPLTGAVRTVLVDRDGTPAWEPYVASVTCAPAEDGGPEEPRVGSWRAPAPGLRKGPEPGVFLLDDRWQTALTWTGLWVGRQGDQPPLTARAADSDVVAIALGVPGRALDDSLWPALERLFGSLDDEVRERAMIQVHGNTGADGMRTLRRLVVRHGMVLAPNGWRSAPAEQTVAQTLGMPSATGAVPSGESRHTGSAPTPAAASSAPIEPPVQYVSTTGGIGPGDHTPAHTQHTARLPASMSTAPARTAPAEGSYGAETHRGETSAAGEHPGAGQLPSPVTTTPGPTADYAPAPGPAAVSGPPLPPAPSTGPPSAPPLPASSGQSGGHTPKARPLSVRPSDPPGSPAPGPLPRPPAVLDPWPLVAPESAAPSATGPWPPPAPVLPEPAGPVAQPEPFAPLFTSADADLGAGLDGAVGPSQTPDADDEPHARAALDEEEADPAGPAAPVPASQQSPAPVLREVSYVPVPASHRSTGTERQILRSHLGVDWERYASAVQRALTRLPGLRSADQGDDELSADLTAVYAYLGARDGLLGERGLAAGLERRDAGALAYLACLASGLRRLPSFRGAAVRTAGVFDEGTRMLLPGEELGAATPVGARALDQGCPPIAEDHYLIWSATGRRTGALADGGTDEADEVVFGPGTRLRVLEVRERAGATMVLLRELAPGAPPAVPGRLDPSDAPVLERLTALADEPPALGSGPARSGRHSGLLDVLAGPPHGAPPM
ncbi:hypothetical protein ACLMNJ_27565 [Streptomyces seoulensis]